MYRLYTANTWHQDDAKKLAAGHQKNWPLATRGAGRWPPCYEKAWLTIKVAGAVSFVFNQSDHTRKMYSLRSDRALNSRPRDLLSRPLALDKNIGPSPCALKRKYYIYRKNSLRGHPRAEENILI